MKSPTTKKDMQLNKQQDGIIRGDTVLWQAISDFRLSAQITQASLITPLPWGRTRSIGRAFLISSAPHWLYQTR